jgi:hypothetical protein
VRDNDGYYIEKVEPLIQDRRPRFGASRQQELQMLRADARNMEKQAAPSIPFINFDMLQSYNADYRATRYNRKAGAAYADKYWNTSNPDYETFDVNCTAFVSQCIFAGDAPMNYTGSRGSGWWYQGLSADDDEQWSFSWAVSNMLQQYLSQPRYEDLRATQVYQATDLDKGDVIFYDWDGEGLYHHTTFVVGHDQNGQPIVDANTVPSYHRYWEYRDSYAWTTNTQYKFFHIEDEM